MLASAFLGSSRLTYNAAGRTTRWSYGADKFSKALVVVATPHRARLAALLWLLCALISDVGADVAFTPKRTLRRCTVAVVDILNPSCLFYSRKALAAEMAMHQHDEYAAKIHTMRLRNHLSIIC